MTGRPTLGSRLRAVALVGAASLVLLELVLRLLTWNGSFLGFPLLPLDPAQPVQAAASLDFGSSYLVFDRELGWTIGAGRRSANGLYESDVRGLRRSPSGSSPEPGGTAWVLAFGDSFTHCDDVGGDQTWEHRLQLETARTVLNLGVPGYGVDQSYLRYVRLRAVWRADWVLIGYMADNIGRHLSRYRPFMYPLERVFFAKPRFVTRGGELVLVPQPLATLEEYFGPGSGPRLDALRADDHWYRPELYASRPWDAWRTARVLRTSAARRRLSPERWRELYADAAAVDLTARLLGQFVGAVRQDARRPLIVFFPDRTIAHDALAGRPPLTAALLDGLRARGFPLLDLTPDVTGYLSRGGSVDRDFLPHYSAALNEVVARAIARRLAAEREAQAVGLNRRRGEQGTAPRPRAGSETAAITTRPPRT